MGDLNDPYAVGVPRDSLLDLVQGGAGLVCVEPALAPASNTYLAFDEDGRVGALHRVGDLDAFTRPPTEGSAGLSGYRRTPPRHR